MLAFLQFDSPSIDLIESMIRAGRLPALAALRAQGVLGPLDTAPSSYEAAIYPTLYTGVDVGDHALYSAFPWSPSEQRIRSWSALAKPATVWRRLAQSGRRALVVDPYQGWMEDVDGLCVSGWQFQNRMVLPRWSAPRDALRALARELGPPPVAETVFGRWRAHALLALRGALLAGPSRAAALVERTLARESFDLVWVTFSGVHLAGHYLWDRSLVSETDLDATAVSLLETAVADVYAATDAALGRILRRLPPGTDVVVFSPDGMGPNTSRSDLLPDMLAAVLGDAPQNGHAAGSAIWRWRAALPVEWRGAVSRLLPEEPARVLTARLLTLGADWSRTRAFALPGDYHGFVRLNLRGRERDGIVDPADADGLLDRIADGLATFRDPDGSPSIAAIERHDGATRGRRAHLLPDLVVRWSERPSARLTAVTSPRFGAVARHGAGPGLPGNHTDGAWMLVVPGARRLATPERRARLVDFAATACAHAGVAAPDLPGTSLLAPA